MPKWIDEIESEAKKFVKLEETGLLEEVARFWQSRIPVGGEEGDSWRISNVGDKVVF